MRHRNQKTASLFIFKLTLVLSISTYFYLRPSPAQTWLNNQGSLITFTIVKVLCEPPNETIETKGRFSISCKNEEGKYIHYQGDDLNFSEMRILLSHFGVNTPDSLPGKHFQEPARYKSLPNALSLLVYQCRSGMQYVPPTSEEVYAEAVQLLANGKVPDLDKYDRLTEMNTFFIPLSENQQTSKKWRGKLSADVFRESHGEYTIKEVIPDSDIKEVQRPLHFLYIVKTSTRKETYFINFF